MNDYKECNACLQILPTSEFYRHNSRTAQLRPKCKTCHNLSVKSYTQQNKGARNAYQRQWCAENKDKVVVYRQTFRQNNPDASKISEKKYRANNPEIVRNKAAVRRARKHGNGKFLITKAELRRLYSLPCFYCQSAAQHLDHVIPLSRGGRHSIGNLVPACAKCNLNKSDRFIMEWKKLNQKGEEGDNC